MISIDILIKWIKKVLCPIPIKPLFGIFCLEEIFYILDIEIVLIFFHIRKEFVQFLEISEISIVNKTIFWYIIRNITRTPIYWNSFCLEAIPYLFRDISRSIWHIFKTDIEFISSNRPNFVFYTPLPWRVRKIPQYMLFQIRLSPSWPIEMKFYFFFFKIANHFLSERIKFIFSERKFIRIHKYNSLFLSKRDRIFHSISRLWPNKFKILSLIY